MITSKMKRSIAAGLCVLALCGGWASQAAAEPRQVTHGVESDLRVVRARLDRQVAAALGARAQGRPV